jgi:hypothetical protein
MLSVIVLNVVVPLKEANFVVRQQDLYSQHFIFFVTCERA